MSDHALLHPRDEILQAMERIYRYRMTTTSGGNLSIREANGDIWITPARVDKGSLNRADIVLVRHDHQSEMHPTDSTPVNAGDTLAVLGGPDSLNHLLHDNE